LGQPPGFKVIYEHSRDSLFGRTRSLRCPHYLADEGGRCGRLEARCFDLRHVVLQVCTGRGRVEFLDGYAPTAFGGRKELDALVCA
jgi:hypothetical protein